MSISTIITSIEKVKQKATLNKFVWITLCAPGYFKLCAKQTCTNFKKGELYAKCADWLMSCNECQHIHINCDSYIIHHTWWKQPNEIDLCSGSIRLRMEINELFIDCTVIRCSLLHTHQLFRSVHNKRTYFLFFSTGIVQGFFFVSSAFFKQTHLFACHSLINRLNHLKLFRRFYRALRCNGVLQWRSFTWIIDGKHLKSPIVGKT